MGRFRGYAQGQRLVMRLGLWITGIPAAQLCITCAQLRSDLT